MKEFPAKKKESNNGNKTSNDKSQPGTILPIFCTLNMLTSNKLNEDEFLSSNPNNQTFDSAIEYAVWPYYNPKA